MEHKSEYIKDLRDSIKSKKAQTLIEEWFAAKEKIRSFDIYLCNKDTIDIFNGKNSYEYNSKKFLDNDRPSGKIK